MNEPTAPRSDAEAVLAWVSEQEGIAEKATKGPWVTRTSNPRGSVVPLHEVGAGTFTHEWCERRIAEVLSADNLPFIATVRTSHPTALAMLRVMLEACDRLGSMEAFDVPRCVDRPQDDELVARIDHARDALARVRRMVENGHE